MRNETIAILEKVRVEKNLMRNAAEASECCGGAPSVVDACCKLDEEKKAEGESGCGCNTDDSSKTKSSCC